MWEQTKGLDSFFMRRVYVCTLRGVRLKEPSDGRRNSGTFCDDGIGRTAGRCLHLYTHSMTTASIKPLRLHPGKRENVDLHKICNRQKEYSTADGDVQGRHHESSQVGQSIEHIPSIGHIPGIDRTPIVTTESF